MTCKDSPCQNGAACVDATKHCSDDTDPQCSFICQCAQPYAGHLCHLYRRCYQNVRVCYQTDYAQKHYDDATEHCLHQGNLTKPIILNRNESDHLRSYVDNDPAVRLAAGSLWLAAEAKRLVPYDGVYWQWIDGRQTSTLLASICLIA